MTNREKFEQEKTEFSKVMELFNASGMADFNEFLNKPACKYKRGDIIVLELNDYLTKKIYEHEAVLKIVGYDGRWMYKVKFLTPVKNHKIGSYDHYVAEFIDANTHLY